MLPLVEPTPSEVKLSSLEARRVYMFFFDGIENEDCWQTTAGRPLSVKQRGYAQALLVNAIDMSFAMGFVEALATAVWNNVAGAGGLARGWAAVQGLAQDFCRDALRHWFRHATRDNLRNPKIYESVRRTIARNFKSDARFELDNSLSGV